MKTAVILPAAGRSTRFGEHLEPGQSKLELELAGKPVFLHAIELFLQHEEIEQIILAVHPERLEAFALRFGDKLKFLGVDIVPGGERERYQTVARALEHVRTPCTHVAVHDAARPLASRALIERVLAAGYHADAVLPATPVTHTLKRVVPASAGGDHPDPADDPIDAILGDAGHESPALQRVTETVDRAGLVQAQTPQLFDRKLLERAYGQIPQGELDPAAITDDAGLIEALGHAVYVVEGEATNLKITHPADAELAEAWLEKRKRDEAHHAAHRVLGDEPDDEF